MGDQFSYALSSLVDSHVNFLNFYLADISLSHITLTLRFSPNQNSKL